MGAGAESCVRTRTIERLITHENPLHPLSRIHPQRYRFLLSLSSHYLVRNRTPTHRTATTPEREKGSETVTNDEKLYFVVDLLGSVQKEILLKIAGHEIPDEWDGHELREYIAEKFADCRSRLMQEPRSRRRRAYNNEVLTRNL